MCRRGLISQSIAKPLHSVNLSYVIPVVTGLGIWRLDRTAQGWVWVPVVMAILLAISTVLGTWFSFRAIPNRASAGTMAIMIPLSNIGHTLAGFITLLLFSDEGYAYNALLVWPMSIFFIFVWLPLARHWGSPSGSSLARSFFQTLFSSQALILLGLITGTVLNFMNVPMGPVWILVLKGMVYSSTVLIMFAMGCRLHLGRMWGYQQILKWIYLVKFLIHPLIVIALCLAFGIHGVAAGSLFIAGCASIGVNVISFATLYDLDVDLANAGYLWSTVIFMLIILPLVILALQAPLFNS